MTTNPLRTPKGFTLVETMVAVTIIMFAVTGPLFTASRSIVAAQIARDHLTASYLAQEGIEYVRAMRDNEYLSAYKDALTNSAINPTINGWTNFLSGSMPGNPGSISLCRGPTALCTLDPRATMGSGANKSINTFSGTAPLYLTNCPSGPSSCTPPNEYTQQNPPNSMKTPFTRTIQVIDLLAPESPEERIISKVSWSFHGVPYSVTVTVNLTKWQ